MKLLILLLGTIAAACEAQPLTVYSEFARLDGEGKILAPETPREILSPALVRDGFTSFQIAVSAPKGEHWRLFVGQNPEKAVTVIMYRERGERLEPVELPVEAVEPAVFWMDVWTPKSAPVARIKIEPQLDFRNDWTIYPVEGRVMDATVPEVTPRPGTQSPVEAMRGLLCDSARKPAEIPPAAQTPATATTMSRLHGRNAQQDLALAARAPREDLAKIFGSCTAVAPDNPEWYLRVRDYLFRLR